MKFKDDINQIMDNVFISNELKEDIMNNTVNKRKIRFVRKNLFLVAIVVVLCVGTIGVFGKEISNLWSKTVASMFGDVGMNNQAMITASEDGFVYSTTDGSPIATDTKNGFQVSVVQVLLDKYNACFYVEVKEENSDDMLPEYTAFCDMDIMLNAKQCGASYSKEKAIDDKYQVEGENRIIPIRASILEDKGWNGGTIQLKLTNLYINGKIYNGIWNLEIKDYAKYKMKTFDMNTDYIAKYKENGKKYEVKYHINKFEISPFGYRIDCDCDKEQYDAREPGAPDGAPIKIIMKDGSNYCVGNNYEDTNLSIMCGGGDSETGLIGTTWYMIDIDQIEYVELEGKTYYAK